MNQAPHPAVRISIRLAAAADGSALRRLAQLDSSPLPPAPHLLATADGRPQAAISLADGSVIADPFLPTLTLVDLLRARWAQVDERPQGLLGRLRARRDRPHARLSPQPPGVLRPTRS